MPGIDVVNGCCHSIYIVFGGNDSSETDLDSELSFSQLEYYALRCLVDAAKTYPDTALCLFQKHDIYLVLSLTLDRTLVGVSPFNGISRIPNKILSLIMLSDSWNSQMAALVRSSVVH